MYQISFHLVHTELRNATFEGEKIATSIKRPDSDCDRTFVLLSTKASNQPDGSPCTEDKHILCSQHSVCLLLSSCIVCTAFFWMYDLLDPLKSLLELLSSFPFPLELFFVLSTRSFTCSASPRIRRVEY